MFSEEPISSYNTSITTLKKTSHDFPTGSQFYCENAYLKSEYIESHLVMKRYMIQIYHKYVGIY